MNTISFLASDSDNVLWDRLSQRFENASILRIASAFLGSGDEILSWLKQDTRRRVEAIVRLEFPTNPDSVAALRVHPQVSIRAANPAKTPFHEKLFLAVASGGDCTGAYIGSANWTQGGLKKNREAGVWVSDHDVLCQMTHHFAAEYQDAVQISDQMLAELRADFLWQSSHGPRPGKDRGTLISSWTELKAANDGRFVIKQNGVSWEPFMEEGPKEFCDLVRNHSAQTFGTIPSTLEQGLGIIVCRIAERKSGRRDRLIYGRGRIAGFDYDRWRLPDKYLAALGQRGIGPQKIEHLKKWPEILWLDPAEYIDYPRGFTDFLWLSKYMNPSFQKGYRWIPLDVWKACNEELNEHTDKYGLLPLDRQGIWWNNFVGITNPDDPLFMTKARIEEMNVLP